MFLLTLRKFCDLRIFRRKAAEAYTHGNQSFFFLDMPLWALLEQTEKTDFWKMQKFRGGPSLGGSKCDSSLVQHH